jgi:hypothetical protein
MPAIIRGKAVEGSQSRLKRGRIGLSLSKQAYQVGSTRAAEDAG